MILFVFAVIIKLCLSYDYLTIDRVELFCCPDIHFPNKENGMLFGQFQASSSGSFLLCLPELVILLKMHYLVLRASVYRKHQSPLSVTLSAPSLMVAIFFDPSFSSTGVRNDLFELCVHWHCLKCSANRRLELSWLSHTGVSYFDRSNWKRRAFALTDARRIK